MSPPLPTHLCEFVKQVREAAACGDLAAALERVADLVIGVMAHDDAMGEVLGSAALDSLCVELGRLNTKVSTRPREKVAIIATGMMPTGGHTRLIADVAAAECAREVIILVTNFKHDLVAADLEKLLPSSTTLLIAPPGNAAQTLRWLQATLSCINPTRTYALQHHFDSVAIAALQPELTGELVFLHHADYALCLGVHLPHAVHVDFHAKGFWQCRDREGLATNRCWPLPVRAEAGTTSREWRTGETLRTCCCGGFEKFETPHLIGSIPYRIHYPDMVATVLGATGGKHYHIGTLSAETRNAIRNRLESLGIPVDAFHYIPFVPSLARTLIDLEVHLYLGSMPKGGGRASVEAMAAGMPLLLHRNYRSALFSDLPDVYPAALGWSDLGELAEHLQAVTPALLREHADLSARWYRAHHTPEVFSQAIDGLKNDSPPPTPPRPQVKLDPLQSFFDRMHRR